MSESDETAGTPDAPQTAPAAVEALSAEEQALVDAHRAVRAQAAAVAEEEATARKARKDAPDTFVGIDRAGNGRYDYEVHPDGVRAKARPDDGSTAHRDVSIVVDGRRYEHVATDADGIWLYR